MTGGNNHSLVWAYICNYFCFSSGGVRFLLALLTFVTVAVSSFGTSCAWDVLLLIIYFILVC